MRHRRARTPLPSPYRFPTSTQDAFPGTVGAGRIEEADEAGQALRPCCLSVLSHPDSTVGHGLSPCPPPDGARGVADCHRRWGIAPRPEDELLLLRRV